MLQRFKAPPNDDASTVIHAEVFGVGDSASPS
jgi:hypothetical protein